jgi:hypothetical protein
MRIMNKIKNLLLVVLFLNISTNLNAKTFDQPVVYWGLNYYSYTEDYAGIDPLMELKTNIPTIILGYRDETAIRSNNTSNDKLSFYVEGSYGNVTYSQYTGTGGHTHDYYMFQTEGVYSLPKSFYAGLGYRYHYDELSDAGPGGYDREQTFLYVPLGYILNNTNGSSLKLQYNYLIEGVNNSDASVNNPKLRFTQDSGYGLDVSYIFPNKEYEIFAKYWDIDDSDFDQGYLEPHNITWEIGFKKTF